MLYVINLEDRNEFIIVAQSIEKAVSSFMKTLDYPMYKNLNGKLVEIMICEFSEDILTKGEYTTPFADSEQQSIYIYNATLLNNTLNDVVLVSQDHYSDEGVDMEQDLQDIKSSKKRKMIENYRRI